MSVRGINVVDKVVPDDGVEGLVDPSIAQSMLVDGENF